VNPVETTENPEDIGRQSRMKTKSKGNSNGVSYTIWNAHSLTIFALLFSKRFILGISKGEHAYLPFE
jgi:hypothetical protein